MAVTLTVLGSGSRGNATLLSTARTRLLIDAGFSRRELLRRLAIVGLTPESLHGVAISHEHSDHVSGLPRLAAGIQAPVFLTAQTRDALGPSGAGLERVETIVAGIGFVVGDIEVLPFSLPHDAADPVGFRFRAEGLALVVVTDLGYLAENVKHQLRALNCLVLESNHDLEMLKGGGYPWELKQRVLSRLGHLSNDTVAAFLQSEFDGAPSELVLAHLSENNNLPALARLSAERALAARPSSPRLHIALQDEPLPPICL